MNAKELLDKYIKYDSKITFDIFKLMYQKLIDLGFTSPYTVEDAFKEFSGDYLYFVMKLYNDKPYFNQYTSNLIEQSEISVEDLLGYNPFESFILPEKWYIKVTGDSINYPELEKWRGTWGYSGISYINSNKHWTAKFPEDFIEITLEQFKKYVLKESIETEFKLPEKWCIEVTKDNQKTLSKWRTDGNCSIGSYLLSPYHPYNFTSKVKIDYGVTCIPENTIEITFEQFKQYVLKEPVITETISESKVEEIVPEYVECFYSDSNTFILNKIYKCGTGSTSDSLNLVSETGTKLNLPYEGSVWKFKPSTKESFEAQNKPKSIEKWSVGSYAVALKDKINWCMTQKGDIYEITNIGIATNLTKSYQGLSFSTPKLDTQFKWFATLTEAEEFAKTLIPPSKFKIGDSIQANPGGYEYEENGLEQPSAISYLKVNSVQTGKCTKITYSQQHRCYWYKIDNYGNMFTEDCITLAEIKSYNQVVHCKTQEEWDFVLSKLRSTCLLSKQSDRFKEYIEENPSGIAVNTVNCEWSDLEWWKEEGYQIISFQEWCDLNGYKMSTFKYKKGECYVVTKECEGRYGTLNFCYQALKDDNSCIYFEPSSCISTKYTSVRPATFEETKEYIRQGTPYNISLLKNPKSMHNFPIEGKCKTKDAKLEDYLIRTKGRTDSKMSKERATGIAWNANSYWWVLDISGSTKTLYGLDYLLDCISDDSPAKINTYGLNVGDKLDSIIIAAWEKKGFNYFSSRTEEWIFGNGSAYDKNRKIESFKVIDGVVGFLVSGTLNIYLRAEGFKEFAENYYAENTSNFKVGSWYKYNGYYLKYFKTDNRNIFIASEYINIENNEFKDNLMGFTCGNADGSKELVTDLSVIQQYLPEGHPDLVTTVNKKVDYISETFKIRVTSREVKRIKI